MCITVLCCGFIELQCRIEMGNIQKTAEILKAIPVLLAGTTFTIGTVLFALLIISKTPNDYIAIAAGFTAIASIINGLAFVSLIIAYSFFKNDLAKRALLLLANIPVAIFYAYILIEIIKL
jgi:hypothetical protein